MNENESKQKIKKYNSTSELPISDLESQIITSGTFGSIPPSKELNKLLKDVIIGDIKSKVEERIKTYVIQEELNKIFLDKNPEDIISNNYYLFDKDSSKEYKALLKNIFTTEHIELKINFNIDCLKKCDKCDKWISIADIICDECDVCKHYGANCDEDCDNCH